MVCPQDGTAACLGRFEPGAALVRVGVSVLLLVLVVLVFGGAGVGGVSVVGGVGVGVGGVGVRGVGGVGVVGGIVLLLFLLLLSYEPESSLPYTLCFRFAFSSEFLSHAAPSFPFALRSRSGVRRQAACATPASG